MKNTETRITGTVGAVLLSLVLLVAGWIVVRGVTEDDPTTKKVETAAADQAHVLGEPAANSRVTLVEFLDFECEGCRAAYPFVEQLRERYADEVTFIVRYFPMPGHANARNAAHAVEAAAQQDALEPMYQRMYETQPQWGEQQTDKSAVFRGFADDLGLDLDQYDQDVNSQQTADRVQRDVDLGLDLGVQGTPTFFLNGDELRPRTTQEFIEAIETKLNR